MISCSAFSRSFKNFLVVGWSFWRDTVNMLSFYSLSFPYFSGTYLSILSPKCDADLTVFSVITCFTCRKPRVLTEHSLSAASCPCPRLPRHSPGASVPLHGARLRLSVISVLGSRQAFLQCVVSTRRTRVRADSHRPRALRNFHWGRLLAWGSAAGQ